MSERERDTETDSERETERKYIIQMHVQVTVAISPVVGQLSGVTQMPLLVLTMPVGQVHFAMHC